MVRTHQNLMTFKNLVSIKESPPSEAIGYLSSVPSLMPLLVHLGGYNKIASAGNMQAVEIIIHLEDHLVLGRHLALSCEAGSSSSEK